MLVHQTLFICCPHSGGPAGVNPTRCRSNIQAHYDISNDLFKVFLDERNMLYSCGIYGTKMGR